MTNVKTNKFFNGIKQILDTNAPTLATFGSVLGLGLTIYFMHKASKQAAKVEEKYEEDIQDLENQKAIEGVDEGGISEEEFKSEKARIKTNKYIRLIYIYRWALISGFASGGLAFLSNYLNGRTIATITGLLALNQEKLKEYAEKGKEMLGSEKFEELRDEVNKEILGKKIEKGDMKVERSKIKVSADENGPDEGYERLYDTFWGEIYDIPKRRLEDAIAEATRMEYLNFNDWRGMLGLDSCQAGYKLKWDRTNPFKAHKGYVNVGISGMHAICYDTQPEFDTMGR